MTTRILNNNIERWGYHAGGGRAIGCAADDCWIKDNVCKDGVSQAIQTQSDQTTQIEYQVYRNEVYNCGMPDGLVSDRWKLNDTGAIYHNGLAQSCDYQLRQNVVYNVNGHKDAHGIYLDNECQDSTVTQNLVFNVQGYAFDCRNVSGNTQNNTLDYNIWCANVRFGDVSGGVYFNNLKIGYGGTKVDSFGSGVTITQPFSGKALYGYAGDKFVSIRTIEDLDIAGGYAIRINPVAKYVADAISGIDLHTGTFTPNIIGSTSSGTATYSRQYGRWQRQGNAVFFDARLTWSGHTGTGNLVFDLGNFPYTSAVLAGSAVPVTIYADDVLFTNQLAAYITSNTKRIEIVQINGAGSSTAVSIDAAGDIAVSGFMVIS